MPSYILSEPYKQRVDNALATVEGMPSQQKTTLIPTRFETLQQPAPGIGWAIVRPISIASQPYDYPNIGVPIKITACIPQTSQDDSTIYTGIDSAEGEVAMPMDLTNTTALPAPEFFAVTVQPIVGGSASIVRCAIKGLCIARVRRFASTDRYVALPTQRSQAESVDSLRGTLESSAAGFGRLITPINDDYSLISI